MAIQKKSLIGKRQSVKKALVAKRVSADTPQASQVKAPSVMHHKISAPLRIATPLKVAAPLRIAAPLRVHTTLRMK
ncbi:MAG: hypothetical protein WB952_21175 [Terriglobales bacterium]